MASWGLVNKKTGKTMTSTLFVPPEEIPDECFLTYRDFLPRLRYCEFPIIRLVTEHAEGFARQTSLDKRPYWDIRVSGSRRDEIKEVIRRLEDSIGALDLNPPLTLPDNIETVAGRIKFLLSWIAGL